jgi:hypothetical protein
MDGPEPDKDQSRRRPRSEHARYDSETPEHLAGAEENCETPAHPDAPASRVRIRQIVPTARQEDNAGRQLQQQECGIRKLFVRGGGHDAP